MKALIFTMTSVSSLFICVIMMGCNNDTIPVDTVKDRQISRVEQAISEAVSNQDYRLYGLAGRRVVLPGFESENFNEIKKRCGVKLLASTGDVLKNNQDRVDRRLNYQFALAVNEQIYALCLQYQTK